MPNFSLERPPAGVSGPGKEYTLPSCLLYRACWAPKNFSRRVLLGDGLFVASMNKTTFALSHPRRNRRQARGGRCKLPQEGHRRPFHSRRAPRLLGCSSPIFWLTRTAIGETAWSSNGGGHQAYRVSQATFSSRNFSPVRKKAMGNARRRVVEARKTYFIKRAILPKAFAAKMGPRTPSKPFASKVDLLS